MNTALVEQGDGWLDVPKLTARELELLIRNTAGHQVGDFCPLRHQFAPGIYAREITMPAGYVIVGKKHRTRHFNIISKGHVSFSVGDEVQHVRAPYTFLSEPGVQKMLVVHEETVWTTIHPTDETDLIALEALLIDSSEDV